MLAPLHTWVGFGRRPFDLVRRGKWRLWAQSTKLPVCGHPKPLRAVARSTSHTRSWVAGDVDLVYVPGGVSNVALLWETPREGPILRELSRFARIIVFDRRGMGMSDRVAGAPELETRMDDLRAVMDAARSPRAAILAIGQGTPMSILFAATYPERTAALVLLSGFARSLWAPDYPFGSTEQDYRAQTEDQLQVWFGTREEAVAYILTRGAGTVDEVRRVVDYYRQSASPGAVQALAAMDKEIDVEKVLPAIHVPTLVVHGTDDTT